MATSIDSQWNSYWEWAIIIFILLLYEHLGEQLNAFAQVTFSHHNPTCDSMLLKKSSFQDKACMYVCLESKILSSIRLWRIQRNHLYIIAHEASWSPNFYLKRNRLPCYFFHNHFCPTYNVKWWILRDFASSLFMIITWQLSCRNLREHRNINALIFLCNCYNNHTTLTLHVILLVERASFVAKQCHNL